MIERATIQNVVCLEELDIDLSSEHKLGYFALGFQSLGLKVTSLDVTKFKKVHQHDQFLNTLAEIQQTHPIDLLFFNHHSDFQFHEPLFAAIRRLKIKTAIWFGDDNHKFFEETSKIAHLFDFPITTCTYARDRYPANGLPIPIFSFWGAEMQMINPQVDRGEQYGVTFVGTWSRYRQYTFDRLHKNGFKPKFFGPGWPSGALSRDQCINVFLNSGVNLSLDKIDVSSDVAYIMSDVKILMKRLMDRKKNYENIKPTQMKRRPFDLAALSAPQLIQYSSGLETFFSIKRDIEIFINTDELILKLNKWRSGNLDLNSMANKLRSKATNNLTISAALKDVINSINEKIST